MRKMFQLLSFGFRKIPYKSEIIKNDLSKNKESCRTDSLSDKDSKNINCVGECPNFQGKTKILVYLSSYLSLDT